MRVERVIIHQGNNGIGGDLSAGAGVAVILLVAIPAEEAIAGLPLRHRQFTVGLREGAGEGESAAFQCASARV